jgi:hypothetical protein
VPSQQYSDHDDDDAEKEVDEQAKESSPVEKALDTAAIVFPPRSPIEGGSPDSSVVILVKGHYQPQRENVGNIPLSFEQSLDLVH